MRDVWLPLALKAGVSYGTFWHLTPRTIRPFLDVYNEHQREKERELDYLAWSIGLYMTYARAATPALGKGSPYPQKPLIQQQEENQEQSRAQSGGDEKAAVAFSTLAAEFNKRFHKGEEKQNGN